MTSQQNTERNTEANTAKKALDRTSLTYLVPPTPPPPPTAHPLKQVWPAGRNEPPTNLAQNIQWCLRPVRSKSFCCYWSRLVRPKSAPLKKTTARVRLNKRTDLVLVVIKPNQNHNQKQSCLHSLASNTAPLHHP